MMRTEVKYWRNSVIKRRIKLHRFSALGIGLSAACLALACGSNDSPSDDPTETGGDVQPNPSVDPCKDNPYLKDCETPPDEGGAGGTGATTGTGGTTGTDVPDKPKTAQELAKDQAQNILLTNCGGCHGTQLTPLTARAGMNFINDMDKLADNKKIIPLDAEASPIIRRMRNQSMPPPAEGGRPVAATDIDIVARYINTPDFWPGVEKATCKDNPPSSFDDLYTDVANDLRAQDVRDRPFMRYISLANRVGAGVCANTTLDLDRQALAKMINSLSIDSSVRKPYVVNSKQTLYRIDLRDIAWNRSISVDGTAFDDVWEAIIVANTYAVPFEGDQADDARADSETEVPVMFLDSMLDSAMIGDLYYAIIGVDVNQSIDTFVSGTLGINVEDDLANEDLVRAGTTKSIISRQDRLIEGHEINVRAGVFYQSFDFEDVQNESIFQNPFGFNEGGREAIFTLPNGMLGYLIADANGALVEDSDILLDSSQSNYRAVTSVSCASCHAGGLIPVIDEVREVVRQNARVLIADGTLNQEQLDQLEAVYLKPEAFASRVKEESEQFYLSALRRADLPVNGVEPVSTTFLRFDVDMTLKDASGDLGLSDAELARELNLLDPALGVLDGGKIDRDDFTALYVTSLCTLSAVNRNRPQQAVCDAAFAELDN
jgi:mono/diheme cytochrome c family protein